MFRRSTRPFGILKASLLGAAITLGSVLGPVEAAPDLDRALGNHVYLAEKHGIEVQATFLADGTVFLQAPVGRHTGRWDVDGRAVCLEFATGPLRGITCHRLHGEGEGVFRSETGTTLTRIASVRRF